MFIDNLQYFYGVCLFILYYFYSIFGLIHKLKFCIIVKFFVKYNYNMLLLYVSNNIDNFLYFSSLYNSLVL